MTIEAATQDVIDCLSAAHPTVVPGLARAEHGAAHIGCYLDALLPAPPGAALAPGKGRVAGLSLTARFLVTAQAPEPLAAQALLSRALLALAAQPQMSVEFAAADPAFWVAHGLAPQPCFALRVPVTLSESRPVAPRVVHPEVRLAASVGRLAGQVVGPSGQGLARARVLLADLGRETWTDDAGSFVFAGLPHGGTQRRLTVEAAGRSQTALVALGDEAIALKFTPEGS